MGIHQSRIPLPKRTVMKSNIIIGKTLRFVWLLLWILLFAALVPCVAVSQIDTSEEGMNKNFQKLMRKSEIIVDAQVVSKESRYLDSNDTRSAIFKPMHTTAIYTLIKFKVFQTIKGVVENNEITVDQAGGHVGKISQWPSTSIDYRLNDHAIFFFSEENSNTGLYEVSRMPIRPHGLVKLGYHRINVNDYIDILKQSVTDTTAFRKYYHEWKIADEEFKVYKIRRMQESIKDTVKQVKQNIQKYNDTSSAGVK